MANRLTVSVEEKEELSIVALSGVIDEDNELSEITARIEKPLVAIKTASIERINSCGVRDWVTWLSELEKRGKSIFLLECPPAIMAQVNLVHNFVGSGTIISFFAPYFCARCDTDRMLLVDAQVALAADRFEAPVCRCDACDLTMEFDDIETSYFSFLGPLKERQTDPAALEKVTRLAGGAAQAAAVRGRSVSIPTQTTTTPTATTPSTPSSTGPYSPTLPAGSLGPLLNPEPEAVQKPSMPSAGKVLYLVVALLVLAIALLGVVILKVR